MPRRQTPEELIEGWFSSAAPDDAIKMHDRVALIMRVRLLITRPVRKRKAKIDKPQGALVS